jgi:hypothetical protein
MGFGTASKKAAPRVRLRHGERTKDHLTSLGGLAALSLDALSSVAYGPEAIVLVLVAAGTSALGLTGSCRTSEACSWPPSCGPALTSSSAPSPTG